MQQQKREYYRVQYPYSYRPSLTLDVDDYQIEDISEFGIKVKLDDNCALRLDDAVQANIAFSNGNEYELGGQVVRIDQGYAGLILKTPLPLSLIRAEHLYIIKNFSN